MKLNKFIFEDTPVSSAEALMAITKMLPGVNVTMNDKRQLVVGNDRGYDAWPALVALTGKSRDRITDEITSQIETHNEHKWLTEWKHILADIVENNIRKIVPHIPTGWRLDHYTLRFLDNPVEPFLTITFAKDIDRQIHASGKIWYHITPLPNKENIKKNGLIPTRSKRHLAFGTYRDKIFLMSKDAVLSKKKLPQIKELAKQLQSTVRNTDGTEFIPPAKFEQVAVFKVKVPISVHLYRDRKSEALGGAYVRYPIPPENLELVYTGDIDNISIN